jgi:hypothetical protein
MFRKGDYMHDKCMDVFIEVISVQYQDSVRAHLKVLWWNLGWTGEPMIINTQPEVIEIKVKDYHFWRELSSRRRHVTELI